MATQREIERITRLETEVKNLQEDVVEVKDTVKGFDEKLDRVIEKMDQKYAAKWVQVVVAGLVAFILLAFIGAVAKFVIPLQTVQQITAEN